MLTIGSLLLGCEQQAPELTNDEKRRQEWQQQKAALLQRSQQATTPEEGREILKKYIYIGDKDALALYREHELKMLQSALATDGSESVEDRIKRRKRILYLSPNDADVSKQIERLEAEQEQRKAKEKAELARLRKLGPQQFCSALRKYPESDAYRAEFLRRGGREGDVQYVLSRKVAIGMSEWGVVCAWGTPEDVNTTILPNSTHKQFVYDSNYVYTEDNVVTAIQQ